MRNISEEKSNFRNKQGVSEIDDKMKRILYLLIGLLICGPTMSLILGIFTGFYFYIQVHYSFLGPLGYMGLLIGCVGLFGIILYRYKTEKLRNYLLKRKESKEEPKVQA